MKKHFRFWGFLILTLTLVLKLLSGCGSESPRLSTTMHLSNTDPNVALYFDGNLQRFNLKDLAISLALIVNPNATISEIQQVGSDIFNVDLLPADITGLGSSPLENFDLNQDGQLGTLEDFGVAIAAILGASNAIEANEICQDLFNLSCVEPGVPIPGIVPSGSPTPVSTPTPSPTPAPNPITQNGSLMVSGIQRNFIYQVSGAVAPVEGRPLVIYLHGDGGNMNISNAWQQAVLNPGDPNGAVFLSAQGRNNLIGGVAWDFRMDKTGQAFDDVDFIDQLIDQALNNNLLNTSINPSQVYVVGESRGAGMAFVLYADPRTRNDIRGIVPISGTFFCEGGAQQPGMAGTQPTAGSDLVCGEVSPFGFFTPKSSLFTLAGGVTRPTHILDIHGELASGEFASTAPPTLDQDFVGIFTWIGWGNAAGCFTNRISSQTLQTLMINGRTVNTYAYSATPDNLAQRCEVDLTFYIALGGGHVPPGFEPTAWCYLSGVGGTPSPSACGV